jgi:formylglycine-generating enzyme required for sulfatase activity
MTGNVWEWTNDWTDYYYYSISPADNPPGPISGICKVFRGGAYNTGEDSLRVSCRGHGFPNETLMSLGFRLARDP